MTAYNQDVSKVDPTHLDEIRRYGKDARLNNCSQWENFKTDTVAKLKKDLLKRNIKRVDILLTFRADTAPRFRWRGCRAFLNNVNDHPTTPGPKSSFEESISLIKLAIA